MYASVICFFTIQVAFGILTKLDSAIPNHIDFDLISVTAFWMIVKIFRDLKARKRNRLMQIDVMALNLEFRRKAYRLDFQRR